MDDSRQHILIFIDWFLPGFRGGGPIRSVANLVDALGEQFRISIVTSDTDYGESAPYPDLEANEWLDGPNGSRVWYCARDAQSYRHMRRLIADTDYDLLYLNSMFSLKYTIFPLWNSRSAKPEKPVILAPRGMLHAGALALKSRKKRFFLWLIKLLGVHKQIAFQATDQQEVLDVQSVFGAEMRILESPNLPRMVLPEFVPANKEAGKLKLVFVSRISIKKGVHFLLECLKEVQSEVSLDLYGPDEEPGYWARCEALIAALPAHVSVRKHDPVPPAEIPALLQSYDAFAMPTAGENFGHAIFEAFAAGRPVMISDQTPWRDLAAAQAGHDIALADKSAYVKALEAWAGMDVAAFAAWTEGAHAYAQRYIAEGDGVAANLKMFADEIQLAQEAAKVDDIID